MKREKAIEIPFGAKDSELIKWEYTIPEGMEAEIKDGKVIIKTAESEYERIRKELIEAFEVYDIESSWNLIPVKHILAWLEKQKEQKVDIDKLRRDLYQSGYNDGYQHGKEDAQKEQKPAEWEDYKDKVNIPYCSSEPEWSEEDERILKGIIGKIDHDQTYGVSKAEMLSFLRSLRNRGTNCTPSWKPSDDLEKAAARYERDNRQSVLTSVDIVNAFIEGAKWQKEQDEDRLNEELIKAHLNGVMTGDRIARESLPMPEDTVIFQKGVAEGRRLEREEVPRWKKGPADSAICARDYWPVSNAPVLGKPETRDYLIVKRGESMLLAFHAEEGDYYLSTEELDKIPTE